MASQIENVLRFVVFKECDIWLAQGVDRDICAQSQDLEGLQERLLDTIEAEIHIIGRGDLSHVGPAPGNFAAMWDERSAFKVELELKGFDHGHAELALCA